MATIKEFNIRVMTYISNCTSFSILANLMLIHFCRKVAKFFSLFFVN